MRNFLQKFFCLVLIAANLLYLWTPATSAYWVDFSSPDKMDDVLSDLGVDKSELKYAIQTFNVSRQKKQPPQVSLTFTPTDPAVGQKVTATATPSYFMNNVTDMYFTWYLKPAGCPDKEETDPSDEKKEKCDLNDDDEINIEDYKIKAMRIIANDDFAWDDDGNGVPDETVYTGDPDDNEDDDGYVAITGGEDQIGKNEHCFIRDIRTGDEFEICCEHLFPKNYYLDGDQIYIPQTENQCKPEDVEEGEEEEEDEVDQLVGASDRDFDLGEEMFWHTNPNDKDTADTGNTDEANLVGKGINNFSWAYTPGDEVGVVVEGVSVESTQEADSSYRTMWAFPKNDLEIKVVNENDYPKDNADEPAVISTAQVQRCLSGCVETPADTTDDTYQTLTDTVYQRTLEEIVSRTANMIEVRTRRFCVAERTDPTTGTLISRIEEADDNDSPYGDLTGHAIGQDEWGDASGDNNNDDDGNNSETASLNFTDPVGEYDCAEYDSAIAHSNNGDIDDGDGTFGANKNEWITLGEGALKLAIDNTTVKKASDLNQFLYQGLTEPSEGGGTKEKFEVNLSYSPQFPVNDTTANSKDGDLVTIRATLANAKNAGYVKYQWDVYADTEPNPESWEVKLNKSDLLDATQTKGMNLDTFKFRLNFTNAFLQDNVFTSSEPEKTFYLKVKLTTTENVSNGESRVGHGEVIIPVSSSDKKIQYFVPEISDSLQFSLSATERCAEGIEASICPVSQNEIVGLNVDTTDEEWDSLLWTIDGQPITYAQCFFDGCDDPETSDVAYFPILKDKGEHYTVGFSAANHTTGEKVNLTKVFEVVAPDVKIASNDDQACIPLLLGHYVDVDGNYWADYSDTSFEALAMQPVQLRPVFTGFTPTADSYKWYVDNYELDDETMSAYDYIINDGGDLIVPYVPIDQSIDIALETIYTQDAPTKKALMQYWKVPYKDFYEKKLTHVINIRGVGSLSQTQGASVPDANKKVLAAIATGLPSYLAFLLRIFLTAFLILAFSRFLIFTLPDTLSAKLPHRK